MLTLSTTIEILDLVSELGLNYKLIKKARKNAKLKYFIWGNIYFSVYTTKNGIYVVDGKGNIFIAK